MKTEKLRKSAKKLHFVVWAFIILVAAAYLTGRLGLSLGPAVEVHDRRESLGSGVRLVGDLSTAMFLFAMMQLANLLRRIALGEMFGPPVTRPLRRFAFWLLLSAVVSIVGPTVVGLLYASQDSASKVLIVADLRDLFFLVTGLVLFLVARVLETAAAIDAELREIV